ncbi:hypothetical protein BpHYR1_002349 [Brachionus plicatilis]|uniref:Uncharacterized protein n=1 Tax=Brachionus plicatilis TaxID=10195 RepID=A0A3M7Q118_BRAPC|nr:hypothetical protein BpHYR1_002349 [Brachionus plicatilis]
MKLLYKRSVSRADVPESETVSSGNLPLWRSENHRDTSKDFLIIYVINLVPHLKYSSLTIWREINSNEKEYKTRIIDKDPLNSIWND